MAAGLDLVMLLDTDSQMEPEKDEEKLSFGQKCVKKKFSPG